MNLDRFLESDPLANKEGGDTSESPDMFDKLEQQEDTQFRASTTKALEENPQDVSQYSELSNKYNVPVEFVKNNIKEYKTQAKKDGFLEFRDNNPIAAARVQDQGKLGLIQDDLKNLNKIAGIARRFNVTEGVEPTKAGAFSSGNAQLKQSVALLHALQNGDDEVFNKISEYEGQIQGYNNKLQSYYGDYFKEGQREGLESKAAWDALKRQKTKDWKGNYLSELANMASLTGEAISEQWDVVAHTDMSAEIRQSLQSAPSSFAPVPFMAVAGLVGAKSGGAIGGTIGAMIPVPGTMGPMALGGATVGGIAAAGTVGLTANTIINYAASVKEQLVEAKIDMTNPQAVKAAMADVEFIKEVKAGALRKGLTVAAIETTLDLVSGGLLGKAFKSGKLVSKVAKGTGALAAEALGEGLGEVGGEYARTGEVTFETLVQGLKEAKGALYLAGGGSAISLAATNTLATAQAVNKTKIQAQAAQDFNNTIQELSASIQESSTYKADPALIADILNSEGDGQAVYYQAEEFKNHWEKLGESPYEKADDLLPGGRAELNKALEQGTALRVPLGDLVTKFGEEESFSTLSELARKDPSALNSLEAKSFTGQLNNIVKELSKQAKKDLDSLKIEQDDRQAVENDIEGQFINAGENSKDAKFLSKLSSSMFNAVGQRALNEDAVTFYRRKLLEIKGFETEESLEGVLYQRDNKTGISLREGETVAESFQSLKEVPVTRIKKAVKGASFFDKQGQLKQGTIEKLRGQKIDSPLGPVSFNEEGLNNFFSRMESRSQTKSDKNLKKAKAKFLAEMSGIKDAVALIQNATHATTQADGTSSLYSIATTDNEIIGLKFDIKGEEIVDFEIMSVEGSKKSEGVAQLIASEKGQTVTTPSNASIDVLKKLINTGRRQPGVVFQEDNSQQVINKLNLDSLGFYSKLAQEVGKMDFKAAPAKDIASRLRKTEGIKKEELEATGILDMLDGLGPKTKITKAEILTFLEAGGIQLEEVTLGGESGDTSEAVDNWEEISGEVSQYDHEIVAKNSSTGMMITKREEGLYVGESITDPNIYAEPEDSLEEAIITANELAEALAREEGTDPGGTKYQEYTLPGGENYREIVITLPGIGYESSHFGGIQDYLAHFRVKDFTTADGKKTMLIEEIQTDLHQEGRKKGYKDPKVAPQINYKTWLENNGHKLTKEEIAETFVGRGEKAYLHKEYRAAQEISIKNDTAIVDAPFKNTEAWSMLVFKRALAMAAEGGYDSVSWTPGEAQAERYDLSRQVDQINAIKGDNGKYGIEVWVGNSTILKETMSESELESNLGKEMAEKIINQEGEGWTLYEEDDLKVGGEGMKAFYDKMLPKAVGKYVKKLDKTAKVGTVGISSSDKFAGDMEFNFSEISLNDFSLAAKKAEEKGRDDDARKIQKLRKEFNVGRLESSPQEFMEERVGDSPLLKRIIRDHFTLPEALQDTGTEVWNLPITEKLRDKVTAGQPLFQKDGKQARGFTDISKPDKILLGLLKDKNKSTSLHELGHVFFEYMKLASQEQQTLDSSKFTEDQKQFNEDIGTIFEILGVSSFDDIQTEQHETWARLFEAYVMEGKAPSARLRKAFNSFKTWLLNIYQNLRGLEDAGEMTLNLDPEMRKVFDRMLATEEEISSASEVKGYSKEAVDTIFDALNLNEEDKARLYNAHEDAKMDAEEELRQRELKKLKTKKRKEYMGRKKQVQAKYEEQALSIPLYRATDIIEKGFTEDPRLVKVLDLLKEDGGLDPDFIRSELGEEVLTRFKKDHQDVLFSVEEVKDIQAKTFAQEIGRGRINTESLSPEQRKMLRENGVHNLYSKNGIPLDIIAMDLEESGLLLTPEDRNADDYLFELLLNKETLAQEVEIDRSMPADPLNIMADLDIISEAELLDILTKKYQEGVFLKLNTDQVKSLLTKEQFKTFPRRFFSSEGIDSDLVAEQVGFANGTELIETISNNPSKQKFIEINTTKEMDTLYPDLSEDISRLSVEALDELDKPDSRRKALRLELDILLENSPVETRKLLDKLIKKLPTDKETVQAAKARVESTAYRQATPAQFRILQDRARNQVALKLGKGDIEGAVKEKTRELFGYEAVKEAVTLRQDIDKRITTLKEKLARKSDKDLSKIGSLDMMKVVQTIMARYGMLTDTQVDKLEIYLDQLKQYDSDSYAKVEGLTRSLLPLDVGSYQDHTVRDVQEILDVSEAIFHLAKEEKQITVDGKKVDREAAVRDLRYVLSKQTPRSIKRIDSFKDGVKLKLLSKDANMTRVEHYIRALDNGDINGSFGRYVWNTANDAQTVYTETLTARFEDINGIIDEHFKGVFKDKEIINLSQYFNGLDPKNNQINRHELIMALLHSGNDSNKKKLILGRGWGSLDMDGNLITKDYDKFISAMISQGKIDKNLMDGVQKIWDLFETIKPDIQKTHKDVYGYFFKEVEANPVETPWGTYRGGYAPAITDPLLVQKELSRINEASTELNNNTYAFSTTPKGFTKERVEAYNRALSLDFRMIKGHVEKAVRFSTLERATQDLNKLFKDTDLTDDMFEVSNFLEAETFRPWIARLATQQTTKLPNTEIGRGVSKALNWIRSNANASLMFLNLKNSLENIVEASALYSKIDRKNLHAALKNYISNPKETSAFIASSDKDMKLRLEESIYEINDTYAELVDTSTGAVKKYKDLNTFMRKNTYILQRAIQQQVETVGWMGAYNQAIAKGLDHKSASREATSVIRTIMGSNRPIDLASIEVGDIYQRMLLTFYSFFLNKFNLIRHAPKGTETKTIAYGFLAPAILSAIFRKSYEDRWDEDDDGYVDDIFDVTVLAPMRFATATIPGGAMATRFVEGQFTKAPYDDRLSISPAISMIESIRGVKGLLTKDELKSRDIKDSLYFFSTFTGLTVSPAGRPIGFMLDVEQGKQTVDGPVDYTRGLITGRSKRK